MAMASDPSSTPPYASSPFDHPKADLILRSSDHVDFRVSKFILEVSSVFFANMFEASQANDDESRDGCPVVQMQEDSETLDSLLRIIYPRKDPILDDLPKLHAVLAAALKYEMEEATNLTGTALRSFIPKEPLRVWAIAVRNRLEEEARAAADEVVRQNISVLDSFPPEMLDINAGAYHRLFRYHRLEAKVEQDFKFCDPPATQSDASPAPLMSFSDPQIISPSHSRTRPLADIICRSSDGQEFPAHKVLLALASPVMAAMTISLPAQNTVAEGDPQSASYSADGLPILLFEEDSVTLGTILGLCYPVASGEDVAVQELHVLLIVIDAVKKYEMHDIEKILQGRWAKWAASDPLRAFFLARCHEANVEAHCAARILLDRIMERYYTPILENSPSSTYRDALLYHRSCKSALDKIVQTYRLQQMRGDEDGAVPCSEQGSNGYSTPTNSSHFLPIKSASCRKDFRRGGLKKSTMSSCRGVTYLGTLDACTPCLSLAETINNALRQLETQPGSLVTALESRQETSMSPDIFCAQCSQPGDQAKLTEFYKTLHAQISDEINKAYADHIMISGNA